MSRYLLDTNHAGVLLSDSAPLWSRVQPASASSAIEFGKIQVELRKKGRPIPAIDVQIAAVARTQDLIILTSDKHFASVDALRVEDWL